MYVAVVAIFLLFAVYASVSISAGIYVRAFCRAKRDSKVIALSFDDGPDPLWTHRVLEVLKRYNVKATFFCIGEKVDKNPLLAKQIVEEGHLIGNHTYCHSPYFPLFGRKKMVADLQRCSAAITKAVGDEVSLFRPPFGVTNPTVSYAVRKLNYKVVGWSIRSFDTMNREREKVLNRIVRKSHSGGVVLMHDNLDACDWLTEQVILRLQKQGYEFVRLDELF